MTDFSSSSVPQIKPDKNIRRHRKDKHKIWKNHHFGGILYIREHFSHHVGPVINKALGASGHSLTLKNRHLLTTQANQPEAEPMYNPQYRYRNERQRMEIAALGVRRLPPFSQPKADPKEDNYVSSQDGIGRSPIVH